MDDFGPLSGSAPDMAPGRTENASDDRKDKKLKKRIFNADQTSLEKPRESLHGNENLTLLHAATPGLKSAKFWITRCRGD